jgi:hypothetical protein
MPRLFVVFDTNLYRTLGNARFDALRAKERARGIVGIASYWVALELIAHLDSPDDPSFAASWAAIRRLVRHCTSYDGRRHIVHFIADSREHAQRLLFGRVREARPDENPTIYGELLGHISEATSLEGLNQVKSAIAAVAQKLREDEAAFRDRMWHVAEANHACCAGRRELASDR